MMLAGIWGAVTGFVKRLPDWAWWLILLVLAGVTIDVRARWDERSKLKNKRAREDAETQSKVITQITENTNAVVRDSDTVRSHDAVRELPDGTQGLPDYHYRD